ncbi:hypothetical protein FDK12_02050 [Arthrobacter sp. NamB2]|uniref:hypothetical protein n=1 Tax=Arthrobacter sp. NamB2 TaxID=2576035 RepID=UPI0010C93AE5|nr:hypothetical protein [Arthrobacter sp. NamB2]TKV29718.1 hypothetical protein FDK12_02050 [Arthrobacter sp. NamB2]
MFTNDYRDRWRAAVCGDPTLSPAIESVASVLAAATATGTIAMTNFRRCNQALGRPHNDGAVFSSVRELRDAGYLGSYRSSGPGYSNGWELTLPMEQ